MSATTADEERAAREAFQFHLEKLSEAAAKLDNGNHQDQKALAEAAVRAAVQHRAVVNTPGSVPHKPTVFCRSCNQSNDYAEANMPDGSYLCFNCR